MPHHISLVSERPIRTAVNVAMEAFIVFCIDVFAKSLAQPRTVWAVLIGAMELK
jgi:hypothetical protein